MSTQFQTIKRHFTTGIVVLLPVVATVWVILWLAKLLESVLFQHFFEMAWIKDIFGSLPERIQPFVISVIVLLIMLLGIIGLGMLTGNVAGGWFIKLLDRLFKRVPIANKVYSFVQGLIENFNFASIGSFERVVLIEFPRKGIYSIGFISRELKGAFQDAVKFKGMAVFVPTSPNPTSGFIVVADSADIIQLDIAPEDALKFVVSGGVLMPGVESLTVPEKAKTIER